LLLKADDCSITLVCCRQRANFAGDATGSDPCGNVVIKNTARSGSGAESGRRRTASSTEKIAVLAPIPRVRAATAASVKAGALISVRHV
jgi:hypothetical protein